MKKLSNYISRQKSVITGQNNLEHLYTFRDFPVFMGCTDQLQEEDLLADMVWEIDPLTGLVQLTKLIPMEILYMHQHMDATGQMWADYNEALADFIHIHQKGNILEIGGGSGKLARHLLNRDANIKYTVVEPNPTFVEDERLKINRTFFPGDLNKENRDDETIVLSQVLEHVYDPESFLKDVSSFLPVGGKFLFGYPNLEYLFSSKFTNAINFEHSMLMTDYYVDYFLEKTGFKVLEKVDFLNHSHFYAVEKLPDTKDHKIEWPVSRYSHYKKMFHEYILYHQIMVDEVNQKVAETGSEVFLFGAHIFSQYLFAFGLRADKIKSVLDNSPIKHGKRLYGSSLSVESPKVLKGLDSPVVILKAGLYNEEIKNDILSNINPDTKFI